MYFRHHCTTQSKQYFQPERGVIGRVAITALMNAVQSFSAGRRRSKLVKFWLGWQVQRITLLKRHCCRCLSSIVFISLGFLCARWLHVLPFRQASAQSLGINVPRSLNSIVALGGMFNRERVFGGWPVARRFDGSSHGKAVCL